MWGAFLVKDNRIFNRPLGHLLSTHSALLRMPAPLIGSLTHIAQSLVGQLKFMNVFTLKTRLAGMNVFLVSTVHFLPLRNYDVMLSSDGVLGKK